MIEYNHILIAGRIDEVPARVVIRIKELERRLLVHRAHETVPLVADAHRAEAQRRDVNASVWAQLAVPTELGGGFGSGCPKRHRLCDFSFDVDRDGEWESISKSSSMLKTK